MPEETAFSLLEELQIQKQQLSQLKWVVCQLMERMKKDKVILYMVRDKRYGLKIEEDPSHKQLILTTKELPNDPVPEADTPSGLN